MRYLTVLFALMVLPACMFSDQWSQRFLEPESQDALIAAPDFAFTSYGGVEYGLSDFRGKVVVLNFWASWCAPCRTEASSLNAVQTAYGQEDLAVIGLSYIDFEEAAREYVAELDLVYITGADADTAIASAYRVSGIPETFIIDRDGYVVAHFPTSVDEAMLRAVIDDLLGGS